MIGLLYRLIVGRFRSCSHEWEGRHEVLDIYSDYHRYHLRCKKCGDITKRELI